MLRSSTPASVWLIEVQSWIFEYENWLHFLHLDLAPQSIRICIQRPHFITLHVQSKVHFKPVILRFSYWPITSVNISDESVTSAASVLAKHLADEQRQCGSG